jgi:hypothetical protein
MNKLAAELGAGNQNSGPPFVWRVASLVGTLLQNLDLPPVAQICALGHPGTDEYSGADRTRRTTRLAHVQALKLSLSSIR